MVTQDRENKPSAVAPVKLQVNGLSFVEEEALVEGSIVNLSKTKLSKTKTETYRITQSDLGIN